jgi:hypothetical protein
MDTSAASQVLDFACISMRCADVGKVTRRKLGLASDLGPNWQKNPDAEAMLAALEDVLPKCLPGPDGFATEDIVSSRIVEAALIHAAALDPKDATFAKGGIGYNVLRSLLARSIAALEHDAEFRDLLQLAGTRELLRRSREAEGTAEHRYRESEQAAERRQRELLEAIARDKGVEIAPLQAILAKLGDAGVPDYEIPARLDTAADELIELRRQLARLTNDRPEFALIRRQALAYIDQGEFEAARAALGRGREAARELREDVSRNEAEFLADEARIDHLQLSYRVAAEKYAQAAALVTSFDRNVEWGYLLKQADELYTQGQQFGENPALLEAIGIYHFALTLVPQAQAPLDWAATQNNLGDALRVLGERGDDDALRRAVAAYEAALDEVLRCHAPAYIAVIEQNLARARALLL